MYFSERHEQIISVLRERNRVTVQYLAQHLHVSEPTIRRDLSLLEKSNRIKRTFGGAVLSDMATDEIPLNLRESEETAAKEIIAKRAVEFIRDGQVLFFDASSTLLRVVKHLKDFRDLTIITNSPKMSLQLADSNIKSFCTGGELLEKSIAYVGRHAEDFVEKFNADVFFFSCRGISEDGELSDSSIAETEVRKKMMAYAKKSVYLCTSGKIGKKYMYNFCSVSDIDEIICEKALPEGIQNKLKKN